MKDIWKKHKLLVICIPLVVLALIGAIIGINRWNKLSLAKSYIEEGNRYLSELNYAQAIASYQQALKIDKRSEAANLGLAECYELNQYTDYAEAIYQTMLDNNPKNAEVYRRLSELYIREGKLDEAQTLIDTAASKVKKKEIEDLYTLTHPDAPTLSLPSGEYTERVRVEISTETPMDIYYTLDGSDPDSSSTLYTTPLILKNGETELRCAAMNSSGFLSEVTVGKYDLKIADEVVDIKSDVIESVVRGQLGIGGSQPIYNDDIAQITELYIIGSFYYSTNSSASIYFESDGCSINGVKYLSNRTGSLTTLDDLLNMPYLETVVIAYQPQLDISGAAKLGSVKRLSLIDDGLDSTDLPALSGLTGLESLCLGWNLIDDISDLGGLKNLTTLSLWGNRVSDVSPAAKLTSLEYLDFSDNRVSDISSLAALSSLEELWMYNNRVEKLTAVSKLDSLSVLMLRGNPLTDADAVRDIYPRLQRIDLDLLELGADS